MVPPQNQQQEQTPGPVAGDTFKAESSPEPVDNQKPRVGPEGVILMR